VCIGSVRLCSFNLGLAVVQEALQCNVVCCRRIALGESSGVDCRVALEPQLLCQVAR